MSLGIEVAHRLQVFELEVMLRLQAQIQAPQTRPKPPSLNTYLCTPCSQGIRDPEARVTLNPKSETPSPKRKTFKPKFPSISIFQRLVPEAPW